MNSLFAMLIGFITQTLISILIWTHVAVNEDGFVNLSSAAGLASSVLSILFLVIVAAKLNFYFRERKALGLVGGMASLDLLNKYMSGQKPDDESFSLLSSNAN